MAYKVLYELYILKIPFHFRLAKHGEILRTNFHRNVSRIKSALPVRLPSYPAGSGSCPAAEDRAGSKGNRNRNGRPLIGAFSGLQERMMNSFQST